MVNMSRKSIVLIVILCWNIATAATILKKSLSVIKNELLTIGLEATMTLGQLEMRHLNEDSLPDDILEHLAIIRIVLRAIVKEKSDEGVNSIEEILVKHSNDKNDSVQLSLEEEYSLSTIKTFIIDYRDSFGSRPPPYMSESDSQGRLVFAPRIIDDATLRELYVQGKIKKYPSFWFKPCAGIKRPKSG